MTQIRPFRLAALASFAALLSACVYQPAPYAYAPVACDPQVPCADAAVAANLYPTYPLAYAHPQTVGWAGWDYYDDAGLGYWGGPYWGGPYWIGWGGHWWGHGHGPGHGGPRGAAAHRIGGHVGWAR